MSISYIFNSRVKFKHKVSKMVVAWVEEYALEKWKENNKKWMKGKTKEKVV